MRTWTDWFQDAETDCGGPGRSWLEVICYYAPIWAALERHAPPPRTLLEVGCGLGWPARIAALRGYSVLGIDTDPAILAAASEFPCMVPGLSLELGDAYAPPVGFDVATSLGVIEHETPEDRQRMLRALCQAATVVMLAIPSPAQLAQPGARTMGERDIPLWQLVRECEQAGLTILEAFGWGNPSPVIPYLGWLPPGLLYRLQQRGRFANSLCVIGLGAWRRPSSATSAARSGSALPAMSFSG